MSQVKEQIKKMTPPGVWNYLREIRDTIGRAGSWPSATFHPWRKDSNQRLIALKDIHKGERCFIVGNGPSLKKLDLSRLIRESTIGMNRFYMAFPELGFTTTYFLCINDLVSEQCKDDLQTLPVQKFVSWRAHKWLKPAENLYYLYTTYTGEKFATDLTGRLWEGATVTYTAMQLAYYLGFQQVILIGVDHNFTTQGKPNTTIVSHGDDPNHFHPGYFGKGFRWQLPDLETSEKAYRMAKEAFEKTGREIIDATVDGKLRVFRRVNYSDLF